ncbi:MAG: N-acetylornithine carbamoyltransferase [Bacteroidota bacterium]
MDNFISVEDAGDPEQLVKEALEIKKQKFNYKHLGQNKSICLIFLNPSLRTRLSTQKAAMNLGMDVVTMDIGKEGWQLEFEDGVVMSGDRSEHIKEAAAVIGSYFDIIGIRSFPGLENREDDYSEKVISQFAKYSGVPVVNLESSTLHPLQSLTDLITLREHSQIAKPKVVLTWAPHPRTLPQAVPNSFAQWMNQADIDLFITHPQGYELDERFSGNAKITHNQHEAFEGADFIYAKNWSSYQQYGQRLDISEDWMVSAEKMALTNSAKFMHCLPVRRNVVVGDAVIDSPDSLVIPQAANREIAAQVVLKKILENMN